MPAFLHDRSLTGLLTISVSFLPSDLLTIPDKDVWAYGQELRAIGAKKFPQIEFSRLKQLVNIDLPGQLDEVTYVANATNFRHALLTQYGKDGLDIQALIEENEDTRLTYCGHSRFLFNDLRYIFPKSELRGSNQYKRDVKYIAREMIRRGFVSFPIPIARGYNMEIIARLTTYTQAFAAAIKKNFPEHLRLSIHQSTGEHKISVSLLPTTTSYTTPWMCAIAYSAKGTLTSAPKGDFEADPTYQVVYRDGRLSHFEERTGSATVPTEVPLNAVNGTVASIAKGEVGGKKSNGPCPHCGKSTHPESRCFDKYPHLAPKWLQERMASLAAGTGRTATLNREDVENETVLTAAAAA